MSEQHNNRRDFLATTLAGTAALSLAGAGLAEKAESGKGMPVRPLGRTGVKVSILCLGGWHIGSVPDEKEAISIMHAAIDEASTSSTTPGITRTVAPRRSWARPWPAAGATRFS